MLNLEELFKKQPFIYCINDVYYAFGNGVCARCDKEGTYITLPSNYQNYVEALGKDNISKIEAWHIFRKLTAFASAVKNGEEHIYLTDKFERLNFSEIEKDEIAKQLKDFVEYFKKYSLADYDKYL